MPAYDEPIEASEVLVIAAMRNGRVRARRALGRILPVLLVALMVAGSLLHQSEVSPHTEKPSPAVVALDWNGAGPAAEAPDSCQPGLSCHVALPPDSATGFVAGPFGYAVSHVSAAPAPRLVADLYRPPRVTMPV